MKIKRLFCLFLALCVIFALASCQKGGFTDKLDQVVNGSDGEENSDNDNEPDGADGTDGSGDTDSAETSGIDYAAYSDGLAEGGFFEGVTALDIVTLPDYRSVEPPVEKIYDRPVADGDIINIDYVGSVDGVEFDGGSTRGLGSDIVVGKTSFIDDFIEQIKGHAPGEVFDIEVTFPDPYQSTDLAGKDAVFNITVNYIWDVDDENAVGMGFEDADEMGTYIASYYASVADLEIDSVMNSVYSACSFGEVPESVKNTVANLITLDVQSQAAYYGTDAETLVTASGYDSLAGYVASMVEDQSRYSLMIQAIAEAEGIEVNTDAVSQAGFDVYLDIYGAPYIHFTVLNSQVRDLFTDQIA